MLDVGIRAPDIPMKYCSPTLHGAFPNPLNRMIVREGLRFVTKFAALLLSILAVAAQGQLTEAGLTLNFDATQDQNGDRRWESTISGSSLDLLLDPLVLRSTGSISSGFAGITHTYSFPGSAIAEATNDLGAQFTATGTGTIQSLTNIAGDPTNNPASWEIWFRPDSLSTSGVDQVLFEDGGGTGISLSVKDGILSVQKLPTLAVKTFNLSTLTAGDFVQAVATYNTTTNSLELFVNGVSVGAAATSGGGDWSGSDPAALGTRGGANMGGFGGGSSGVASFDGDIAAFRFYESILSASDVLNNYNAVTATTVTFDNDAADGLWSSQSNWDTNIQPTSAQDVVIDNSLSVTVDAAGETAKSLTLGSGAGAGTLVLSGGDLTLNGAIIAGSAGSTLTVNGGTLNMNGNAIGSGAAPITNLTFAAGVLDSVAEINGGATFVKTTAGTLTLSGTNTYTGATAVDVGTFVISGTMTSDITVADGANLDGEGSTTGNVVFLGTTHTINADTSTPAVLGATGAGSLDVSALNAGGFTVNITGTTFVGTTDILTYGSGGFTGTVDKFVASTALTPSARGTSFADNGTAITFDLGYVTNTWTGGVNGNWDIGATNNWNNAKDSVFQNGDDVLFDDTTTRLTVTLQASVTAGTLTFNNSTGKNYTVSSATTQILTVNDGIQFTGSGNVTISARIAGNAAVTKSGTGTVTLSGANTYSGLTTVNEGTLRLVNSAISSARLYGPVAAGATLEFNVTTSTNPGVFNLSGEGTFLKSGGGAFAQTSAGSIFSMGSGALIRIADGTYDFGGGGLGDWSANKADFQVDFGATFDGSATAIVIDALNGEGTMKIAGNTTDGFALKLGVDGGSGTFTGTIVNSTPDGNVFSVVKEGAGTQILSGNNTYTGVTTVNGGLLVLSGSLTGDITVAAGANIGGEASTAGKLSFLGATHTLEVDARTAAVLGSTGAGGLDISAIGVDGLTVNIVGIGNGGGAGGAGGLKVLSYGTGAFTGDLNSLVLGSHTLSSRLAVAGPFVDDLAGAITIDLGYVTNTWSGGINNTWDTGATANWANSKDSVFQIGDDVIFADGPTNLAPTLVSDITAGSVIFSNTTGTDYTLNSTASETLTTAGTLSVTGSGDVTINAKLSAGGGVVTSGSGSTVINGEISGASGLKQSGNGTTTLTGNNTFSGGVVITDGTLRLSDETNLGANPAAFSARQLIIDGAGATLMAASTFTINDGNRGIYLGGGGAHIGADVAITLTIARVIDGIGSLDKTGDGILELTAANTYTGTTTVSAGTLKVTNSALTPDRSYGTIATGATLEFNFTSGATSAGIVNLIGGGTFKKTGAGALTQTSGGATIAMDAGALIHIAEGSYQFGAQGIGNWSNNKSAMQVDAGATYIAGATPTVIDGLNGAGTIQLGGGFTVGIVDGNGRFSGTLTDNATYGPNSLTKVGTGTQILSGSSDYTGGTFINVGTIVATSATALGLGDVTVAADAGLSYATLTDAELSIGGNLSIAGGTGTVIGGAIGSTGTSAQINVTGDATATAGTVLVNIFGIPGVTRADGTTTHTLVHGAGVGSALNGATYALGAVLNNTNFTVGNLIATATDVQIDITKQDVLTAAFWTGGLSGASNVWAASNGTTESNWVTSAGGGVTALVPGVLADVTFSANTVQTDPAATFLGADMSIKSLTIQDAVNGLNLGADAFTLTIENDSGADLTVASGAAAVTLDAGLVFTGATPTIVVDGSNGLSIGGTITSANGLTKTGVGTLTLSGVNAITGSLAVQNGSVLLVGGDDRLPGTSVILGSGVESGRLVLGGASEVRQEIAGLSTNGTGTANAVVGGAANLSTLVMNVASGTSTFTGTLGGVGLNENNLTLIKSGAGTFVLGAGSTFAGVTEIEGGVLVAADNAALSSGSVSLTDSNAALEIGDGVTISNALTVSDKGGNKILQVSTGTGIYAGVIDVQETGSQNFDLAAAVDTVLKITGVISGVGSVNSTGDGTIEFDGSAANTFSGDFHLGDGAGSTFDGTVGAKQGFVIVHRGDALGTGTIISRGSQLQAGTTGVIITNNINVDGGGLRVGGSNSFEISGIAAPVLGTRGFGHYGLDGVTITLSGGLDLDEDGTPRAANFEGTNAADNGDWVISGNITGGGDINIINSFDSGVITLSGDNSGHTGNFSVAAGTLELAAANAINGGTVLVNGGSLLLGVDNAISDGSVITLTSGSIFTNSTTEILHSIQATGGILFLGTSNNTGTGDITLLNNSTIQDTQTGVGDSFIRLAPGVTLSHSGTITQLGDNESVTFDVGVGGSASVLGAVNSGNGNGAVNKTGAGILVLSNDTSAFGGGTRIENGTLEFTSISSIGAASSLGNADTLNVLQVGSSATAGTLRMTGTNALNSSDRAVQLGDAGGTIDVADAAQTLTLSGVISDHNVSGSLTKAGLGTLILSGGNTYGGDTTISAGTLQVGDGAGGGALGAGGGNVLIDTVLIFNTNDDNSYTGVFSGSGTLTHNGTGTTSLLGANTYTGNTAVNAGTLKVNGTLAGNITVASGANIGGEASTTGNLVFQGAAHTLEIDAGTVAALGSIGLGGTDVSALGVGGLAVNIVGFGPGAIKVLTYGSGGFAGDVDRFVIGTAPAASARGAGGFVNNGTDAITIDLGFVSNVWKGTSSSNIFLWDVGTTDNWVNTADVVFQNGDSVIFGDQGNSFIPTLGEDVTTGAINFETVASTTYNLALNSFNLILGGDITANEDALISGLGSVRMSHDTTVTVADTKTLTVGSVISDGGSGLGITKDGAGTLTVFMAPTYTGATTVNGGTLRFENAAITSNRDYGRIAAGATLEFNVTSGSPNGGTITLTGEGTFLKTGSNKFTQISAGSTIAMDSGAVFHVANGIYDFGGAGLGDWTANRSDLKVDAGATFDGSATAIVVDALTGSGTVAIAGNGTDGFALKIGVDNGGGTFSGTIVNSTPDGNQFSVIKEGDGTQVLTGNNTYTGATAVKAGALHVGSAGSGTTGTGNVTVQSGGTILGTGVIQGTNVTADSGSTIQAGDGTAAGDFGTLNFTPATGGGTVSLQGIIVLGIGTANNQNTFDPLFGGNEVGTAGYISYVNDVSRSQGFGDGSHDLLAFNTAGNAADYTLDFLTASGTLQVVGSGFTAEQGQIFNLLDWSGITGGNTPTFGSLGSNYRSGGTGGGVLDLPDISSFGLVWDVSQFSTSGIVVVVPEPGRMSLIGLGLAAALLRRRRRSPLNEPYASDR